MILENLFAQAAQGETFLRMCLTGVMLGCMLHLCSAVRRRSAWLGAACEVLSVLLCAAAALVIMLRSGSGLRLYALLGLTLGAVLYQSGWRPVIDFLQVCLRKVFRPAGKRPPRGESM